MSETPDQAAEETLRRAVALHQNGRLAEAASLYEDILRSHPTHFDATFFLGISCAQQNLLESAARHLARAATIKPTFVDAHFNCARVLHSMGRLEEALESYDRTLALKPDHLRALHHRGLLLSSLKRFDEALSSFDAVLRIKPDQVEALVNRGTALGELGRIEDALRDCERAIAINPGYAEAHSNRGNVLSALKRYEEALESYDRAIELKPDFADAHSNRGSALSEMQRFEEALQSYDRVIQLEPTVATAYYNRAVALAAMKRFDEAIQGYDCAVRLDSNYAQAYCNRGVALGALERFEEAVQSYDNAVRLRPDFAEAFSNRGVALVKLERYDEALRDCDRAIDLNPCSAIVHYNRGIAFGGLERFEEALQSCDRAIGLQSDYAEAYCNHGTAAMSLKRYGEALQSYDRAIELKPNYVEAHSGRGAVLFELGRFDDALRSYERVRQLAANPGYLMGQFMLTKMRVCDWGDFRGTVAEICDLVSRDQKASAPFNFLAQSDSPALQRKAAEIWVRDTCSPRVTEAPVGSSNERIRVGYFSADFHNHASTVLAAEMFERHDRSKFDLVALSFAAGTDDSMHRRVKAAFENFIDIRALTDRAVVELAKKLEIDIAVDLMGFTKHARTNIFARRVAPIQVNFLGYPGTMGAEYIDYLIADEIVVPTACRSHYAEKIAYLPNTYQPNDRKREISDRSYTRAELGLPAAGFVFCCFNNSYKITPDVFDSWTRILRRVEGSVLWLLLDNDSAARNLRKEAAARGVDPGRIAFAPRMALPDHLARHRVADLFLDTLPYNAHTTASDALWAGLPVLTCTGETFAGRVAASLLHAVHLPNLATTTRDAYEDLAVELATDPAKLAGIKQTLAANRLTTPLFDSELFTKHLEAAYAAMYARYQAGLPPHDIFVPQSSVQNRSAM